MNKGIVKSLKELAVTDDRTDTTLKVMEKLRFLNMKEDQDPKFSTQLTLLTNMVDDLVGGA